MSMRILLTGHNGYIGSVMMPLLAVAGHEVVGLDTDYFAPCTFGTLPAVGAPEIHKDLRSITGADLAGFEAVVHLAGLCNDPLSDLNPQLTWEINYKAGLRLAVLAKAAGVRRFVVASSCSIYGSSGAAMVDETGTLQPLTVYAMSKVKLDEDVAALADADFSPTFLRNATAYGVSPRLRLDLVLNSLVASAFTSGLVLMKSDGTPWRPIVHIEDIARAFEAVLAAPRELVHNQAFNVGINQENYQMRDLAEIVRSVVPGSRIEYAPGAGPDARCYQVDFRKIHTTLPGFRPQWNARRGAQELFDAFRKTGLSARDCEGSRFRRLDYIRELMGQGHLDEALRWAEPQERAVAASASYFAV